MVPLIDQRLSTLNAHIAMMGGLAERALAQALRAHAKPHQGAHLAAQVQSDDFDLDQLEIVFGEMAVEFLARERPVARDLRAVLAASHIARMLEALGDDAVALAQRAETMGALPWSEREGVLELGRKVHRLLSDAVRLYGGFDEGTALELVVRARAIEATCHGMERDLLDKAECGVVNVSAGMAGTLAAHDLARCAGECRAIVQQIYLWHCAEDLRVKQLPPPHRRD